MRRRVRNRLRSDRNFGFWFRLGRLLGFFFFAPRFFFLAAFFLFLAALFLFNFARLGFAQRAGAGIALFTYDGQLCWGFNADWDAFPDLHDLVEGVELEFAKLCEAAEGA